VQQDPEESLISFIEPSLPQLFIED